MTTPTKRELREAQFGDPKLPDRFWNRVVPKESGCWQWVGELNPQGYGRLCWSGKSQMAHRIIYSAAVGVIADGLTIDHLCRNRACVNPTHLEAVSLATNILRGESPPAKNAKKTHCSNGHKFSGANLYIRPSGYRLCRACKREWAMTYRRKYRDRTNAQQRQAYRENK